MQDLPKRQLYPPSPHYREERMSYYNLNNLKIIVGAICVLTLLTWPIILIRGNTDIKNELTLINNELQDMNSTDIINRVVICYLDNIKTILVYVTYVALGTLVIMVSFILSSLILTNKLLVFLNSLLVKGVVSTRKESKRSKNY